MQDAKLEIEKFGRVTAEIKNCYFKGKNFREIRAWLKENGLDEHLPLELQSTEIAIVTPYGILMQIRTADNNQLGLWGGAIEEGETPEEGAIRELREETGLTITREQLIFLEEDTHSHTYANGDKAIFHAYRYKVEFDYIPKITTDEESVGVFMVTHTILSSQQELIKKILENKL